MLHFIFYKNDSWGFWWNLKLTAIYAIAHFVDGNLNLWLADSRGNFEQKCKFLPLKERKPSENTGFYSTIRIVDLAILCFWLQNGQIEKNIVLNGIQEDN